MTDEVASSSQKSSSLNLDNLKKLPTQPPVYQQPFQFNPVVREKETTFITGGAEMPDTSEDETKSKASTQ